MNIVLNALLEPEDRPRDRAFFDDIAMAVPPGEYEQVRAEIVALMFSVSMRLRERSLAAVETNETLEQD
jgi:hypothetical protein